MFDQMVNRVTIIIESSLQNIFCSTKCIRFIKIVNLESNICNKIGTLILLHDRYQYKKV